MTEIKPTSSKVPKHIGIILDGNRRFARRLMMEPWKGHELGFEKLKKLFEWCYELKIKELSLYCFSMQNFNRPKKEFDYLMDIFEKMCNDACDNEEVSKDIDKYKVRINVLGKTNMLPEKVQKAIKRVTEKTKNYDEYTVNLCLAYGGREEIVEATRRIIKEVTEGRLKAEDIDEEVFGRYLYTDHQPDLIIRTGGEMRTSNFLSYQAAYSEWFFLKKMWPEFEKEDLIEVIEQFKKRERRFGK